MPTLSQVLSSRTVQAALVLAILSGLQGFVFMLPITPAQQALAGIVLSVVIIVLRAITDKALSAK